MKKIFTYALAIAAAVSSVSCEGFLDITPEGQVKREDLLTTHDGIEDALYGVYAKMRQSSLYGQELSFSTLEIMSQALYCYGNTKNMALIRYDYTNTDVKDIFESVWTQMYNNISNANSVINCEIVENASAYPATIYRGEALALRALMHFDLMRIFAPQITVSPDAEGIPYATTFSLVTPDFESLAANYEHVIADLLEAEQLLADEAEHADESNFMLDRQIHLNINGVRGLLARVYLTKGDTANALKYAQKVIETSGCRLNVKTEIQNDLAGVLSRNETLFGVYYANFYSLVSPKLQQTISYSSLSLRDGLVNLYEQGVDGLDYRVNAYFTEVDNGGTATYRLSKLTDIYELQSNASARPSDLITGINMIRLPEMYYIAAEALLNSDPAKALEYYNAVITSRGLSASTGPLTQDMINTDRYKEYIGEGQTFFNMKRQNLDITSYDSKTVYRPADGIYTVPVPDSEKSNRN
jgi:tetratricopeptide (TPR) repeat protein